MLRSFLRAKLHRLTVTGCELHYEGSLSLDRTLIEAAGLSPYERIEVYNVHNGQRFATYVIEGESGSGQVVLNGAAARLAQPGDLIIVAAYGFLNEAEVAGFKPRAVHVDAQNRITRTSG